LKSVCLALQRHLVSMLVLLFCNCTLYRCSIEFLVRCCLRVRAGKSSVRDFRRRRVANHWMSFVFTTVAPAGPFARVTHSHVLKLAARTPTSLSALSLLRTLGNPPSHRMRASIPFTKIRPTVLQHQFPSSRPRHPSLSCSPEYQVPPAPG
jgi:hypothetical protein